MEFSQVTFTHQNLNEHISMFPYIDHIKEKIKKGADGMLFRTYRMD